MSFTRTSFILAASIAAGLAAVGSSAALQSKCLAGKNRCMSKEAYSLLKCEQRAEIPGTSIEPALTACRQKARSKFDGATVPSRGCFETLEGKTPNDCFTSDDTDAAAIAVDDCVTRVVDVIDPAPIDQSACNVGKKKCAAKKLKSLLKCHEKAQKPGPHPIEELGECIQQAVDKFDGGPDPTKGCITKLEARSPNDCVPPLANTAAVEAAVDSCAGAFVALIESTTTTTLPEIHCCDVQISCDFCYPNDRICSAAFLPGAPIIPPPGCVADPHI